MKLNLEQAKAEWDRAIQRQADVLGRQRAGARVSAKEIRQAQAEVDEADRLYTPLREAAMAQARRSWRAG